MKTEQTQGERIRNLRKQFGDTQKQMAFKTGIKQANISDVERWNPITKEGRQSFSKENINIVAKVYKTTKEYIVFGTKPSKIEGFKILIGGLEALERLIEKDILTRPEAEKFKQEMLKHI